ncbi:YhgE/Pip family protein [Microbacterium sp. YY-03]|uniref:YhgE/Pip family protein n=1 Tax=Microbacterium sp. YY-03 TaxID=3421636 RepID=UPI003D177FB1
MSKKRPSARLISRLRTGVIIAAIAAIPLIYAGALTWSNQDPTHNLDQIPAAVVNNDVPAKAGDSTIELGDEVTKELVDSTAKNNFDWVEYDAADAAAALENGDVLAVLTIPENFSQHAASPAEANPVDASVATISIETNDGANMISGTIAATIATSVRESLASEVSAAYLEQIYLGFTDIHTGMTDARDGATQLSTGANEAKDGSNTLVVGLTDLASGTVTLNTGAQTLATGAGEASTGADTLAQGLALLSLNAADLPTQATQLNTGASALATGASQLSTGLSTLSNSTTTLATGAATARDSAQLLSDGLTALAAQTPSAATGAEDLKTGIDSLTAAWSLLTDEQKLASLSALSTGAQDLADGLSVADASVQQLATGGTQLVGSSEDGTGLSALADGATALATGATTAATSATTLSTGAATLATGTQALADAAPTLTSAIATASTGATDLAAGVGDLATGASTLANGTASLETGAQDASTGASDLATGLNTLADGTTELRDGLVDGADEVPTYTDGEAKSLSTVASDPIATDNSRLNEVAGYGHGLAPYFLSLALWVGALAFYLMFPAMNKRALVSSRTAIGAAVKSYLPGATMAVAQSVLAVMILTGPVGIHAVNPWGLWGIALLTSLTFVAINQALIALLGAPGRFLALIMIVLQLSAAGGTYPIQTAPSFFQSIHTALPLTHSLEAMRSMIAGGNLGVSAAIGVLSGWLVGALLISTLAALFARRTHRVRSAVTSPDTLEDIDDPAETDANELGEQPENLDDEPAAPTPSPATVEA